MARKYPAIDVVKMFATLTEEHWRYCLETAISKGSIEKLMAWRYGMQAGCADAVNKGVLTDPLALWVMKRINNLERAARVILKRKHPSPLDAVSKTHKGRRIDYIAKAKLAKKKRDREFEQFLMRSNY